MVSGMYKQACWWWQLDWSFAPHSSSCHLTSIILHSNKIQNGDILELVYSGYLRKWPLNECHID